MRLFAAAAEAVGVDELTVDAASVADLRASLGATGEDAERVVGQCAILRDGDRLDNTATLASGDTVDVLPPFAGG